MPRQRLDRFVFFLSLGLGLAMRLRDVFGDDGISWPDEVYQSLEPAHRLVFGHGLVAWEFVEGARTWALPGLVAGVLRLCVLVGASQPAQYVHVVKVVFALLSLATAWGVYRLAMASGAQERPAVAASTIWSLAGPVVYFAPRAMSENVAAALTVWGLALVLDRAAARRALLVGASLLGLSVLFRLQSAVFCAGAVAVLASRHGFRQPKEAGPGALEGPLSRAALVLLALVGWAVVYGALDAACWHDAPGAKAGGWFHSAVVYLRFNLLEGKASGWGTAPWTYYLHHLWTAMPAVAAVLAVGAVLGARTAPGLLVLALVFFALHCAVAHKELRFILPVLPLFCALAGVGLSAVGLAPLGQQAVMGAATVLALASGLSRASLTFGDLGSYPERAQASAWDDFGNLNRLLLVASQREDLCGLRIDAAHLAWTGGATYLHRKAPLYMPGTPVQAGHFNYAITFPGSGAETVARDTGLELVRLPGVTCVPDLGYTWRLP